jgi:uncharacterized protein (TIGR02271 family)
MTGPPEVGRSFYEKGRFEVDDRFTGERDEASVTRSKEELRVGTDVAEAGRVRLRKTVESQPVTEAVDLQRETARIERVSVGLPAASGAISEAVVEIPLHAERPVVVKRAVAKERIALTKDLGTAEQEVVEEVRREPIEVDEDTRGTGA